MLWNLGRTKCSCVMVYMIFKGKLNRKRTEELDRAYQLGCDSFWLIWPILFWQENRHVESLFIRPQVPWIWLRCFLRVLKNCSIKMCSSSLDSPLVHFPVLQLSTHTHKKEFVRGAAVHLTQRSTVRCHKSALCRGRKRQHQVLQRTP